MKLKRKYRRCTRKKGLFEQLQAFSHTSLTTKNFPAENNDMLGNTAMQVT